MKLSDATLVFLVKHFDRFLIIIFSRVVEGGLNESVVQKGWWILHKSYKRVIEVFIEVLTVDQQLGT